MASVRLNFWYMPVVLEIPVKTVVKRYYEHPNNFGADMVANQRSAVGRIITAVMSFYPLQEGELPVSNRVPVSYTHLTLPTNREV